MSTEKKETPVISKEKLLEALQDLLKQQRLEQESLKRDKRARGGLTKGLKTIGALSIQVLITLYQSLEMLEIEFKNIQKILISVLMQ